MIYYLLSSIWVESAQSEIRISIKLRRSYNNIALYRKIILISSIIIIYYKNSSKRILIYFTITLRPIK